ncbi:hypothetical protein [Chondromyces apiculatus]|uniref:Uncharacterized protein n=1 Tax=Chondromyces apiculatus DSM 436 TaxID=1192034 RepID=A0A017T579_9BACT|nr:hypothetical protein [Chondromyces apiculatus]EYF04142.1 Hypothetical protein CAP_4825 [Chondromyces apiculatus DSM 436]
MATTLLVKPYAGSFAVDFQHLDGVLVDLPEGGTRGLRREKDEWDRVDLELATRLPLHAATLRVAPDLATHVTSLNERLEQVRAFKVAVDKLAEVAMETEAFLEDEREAVVGLVVDAVRKAAKRTDPTMMTAFEDTVRYHGQVGKRAVKTRRRNEEAAAQEAAAEEAAAEEAAGEAPGDNAPEKKTAVQKRQ